MNFLLSSWIIHSLPIALFLNFQYFPLWAPYLPPLTLLLCHYVSSILLTVLLSSILLCQIHFCLLSVHLDRTSLSHLGVAPYPEDALHVSGQEASECNLLNWNVMVRKHTHTWETLELMDNLPHLIVIAFTFIKLPLLSLLCLSLSFSHSLSAIALSALLVFILKAWLRSSSSCALPTVCFLWLCCFPSLSSALLSAPTPPPSPPPHTHTLRLQLSSLVPPACWSKW